MLTNVSRSALMPASLTRRPFTLLQAKRAGLERWHLEGRNWTRVGRATYLWSGLAQNALRKLEAVELRLPPEAAFSGLTSAWLHGVDVEPCEPIEVTIPKEVGVSGRVGVVVRRAPLDEGDVLIIHGLRATSPVRTIGEVCSRLDLTEAVVVADMALHAGLVSIGQLELWARTRGGRRGIKNLRLVLDLVEPAAESPMESRLRMLLVLGGLPRPQAQVSIHDDAGRFVGRLDLFYEHCRLGIEYDGAGHRETLADDDRRQNRLLSAGVTLLRFTSSDVLKNPSSVLAQVRAQVTASAGSRGLPGRFNPANAGTRGKNQTNAIAS